MAVRLLEPEEIVSVLTAGPEKIVAAITGLTDKALTQRPEVDEWSPLEILARLRACADVWGDVRILRMLEEDEPTIKAVNPMAWIVETDYYQQPFGKSFEAFQAQRVALLERLRGLERADWERGAMFTGGGKPRQYTVQTEADALARHERVHVKQIERRCILLRG